MQNNSSTLNSRNGKLLSNFPHIEEALSKPEFNNLVFDGEVMSEDFQSLMKQVHRKEGAQTQDAYLALFDMLTLDEFIAGGTELNAFHRRERMLALDFDSNITVVDATLVNFNTPEGTEQFDAMNKEALDKGYEGLMIRQYMKVTNVNVAMLGKK